MYKFSSKNLNSGPFPLSTTRIHICGTIIALRVYGSKTYYFFMVSYICFDINVFLKKKKKKLLHTRYVAAKGVWPTHQPTKTNLVQLNPLGWFGFYGLVGWVGLKIFFFNSESGWVRIITITNPPNLTQSICIFKI